MEIQVVADQEIAVGARVRRAVRTEHMAGDLVQVEGGGEEIVAETGAEDIALVADQPAFGRRAGLVERVHQVRSRALHAAVVEHVVDLAEDAAVDRVADAVAETRLGEVDERAGEQRFALRREGDLDRVVHAAGHDDVEVRPVGTGAVDVGGLVVEGLSVAELVGLLGERALGPVDVAVRPEIRAMDVVRATGERAALEPLLAAVGHAVAVVVAEAPDARRRRRVDPAVVPQAALREHHLVGEHDRLVEDAVAVRVLQPQDPGRGILQLLGRRFVGAGRIGDVKAAAVVETAADRTRRELGGRGQLDGEPVGDGELSAVDHLLGGLRRDRRDQEAEGDGGWNLHGANLGVKSPGRRNGKSLQAGRPLTGVIGSGGHDG